MLRILMQRYPDPAALSAASELELRDVIRPLGFATQRSSQMRAMAQVLVTQYGGDVPSSAEALERLPGVGPYTAGIVAATLGEASAAVDTNVARVLCRVFDISPSHAEARKSRNVWDAARRLVAASPQKAAPITWSLIDLASAVCRLSPLCPQCPLETVCTYRAALKEMGSATLRERNLPRGGAGRW